MRDVVRLPETSQSDASAHSATSLNPTWLGCCARRETSSVSRAHVRSETQIVTVACAGSADPEAVLSLSSTRATCGRDVAGGRAGRRCGARRVSGAAVDKATVNSCRLKTAKPAQKSASCVHAVLIAVSGTPRGVQDRAATYAAPPRRLGVAVVSG
jgi:hypothetical protein